LYLHVTCNIWQGRLGQILFASELHFFGGGA
jgi:hypothetical protein